MKIFCIGRNYSEHAKEMNAEVPQNPLFFMKPDTSVLKGNDFYFPNFTKDLHYECELVVRISRAGKNIQEEFAHKYYTEIGLGIDFTARDLQSECKKNGWPWELAKSWENSAPVSHTWINKSELDLANISFQLDLNGQTVQKGNSSDMIFKIDRLIAHLSQYNTLKVGDLIFTGTPSGVGPVQIGDTLVGRLEEKEMFALNIK
ncbi:fumarylacetoacetate hydrolase family protein [Crocinitomicaceae bacterium]|jgi:acylpyruvate hydrolase|nr:fumarylacetoacetate hydrolase family protein [Crocinitomicaceae bacterium]